MLTIDQIREKLFLDAVWAIQKVKPDELRKDKLKQVLVGGDEKHMHDEEYEFLWNYLLNQNFITPRQETQQIIENDIHVNVSIGSGEQAIISISPKGRKYIEFLQQELFTEIRQKKLEDLTVNLNTSTIETNASVKILNEITVPSFNKTQRNLYC